MAPRKRKKNWKKLDDGESSHQTKRVTKSEIEKQICKKKLDALDLEESQIKEDRFSPEERKCILEAYNERGFQVFNDTSLLHQYLPDRRESDLKGLIQRLKANVQNCIPEEGARPPTVNNSDPLDDWQRLCQKFMGNFAKDKRINLDEIYADALLAEVEEKKLEIPKDSNNDIILNDEDDDLKPDYAALLKSFAQMLTGKFPDTLNTVNSLISMKLYDHVFSIVDKIDNSLLLSIEDGRWLEGYKEERQSQLEAALKGLEEIDGKTKKCPTLRDLEKNRDIEALCLELPKIKRITDVLNPLHFNELLVSTLMEKL